MIEEGLVRVCLFAWSVRAALGNDEEDRRDGERKKWEECEKVGMCCDADLRRQYQNKSEPLLHSTPTAVFKTYVSLRLTLSTFIGII